MAEYRKKEVRFQAHQVPTYTAATAAAYHAAVATLIAWFEEVGANWDRTEYQRESLSESDGGAQFVVVNPKGVNNARGRPGEWFVRDWQGLFYVWPRIYFETGYETLPTSLERARAAIVEYIDNVKPDVRECAFIQLRHELDVLEEASRG